jgi:alpha 1,3-glucosidase
MTRWYQLGAFQPFFRGHAHIDAKRREPWLFGEPFTSLIRDAIRNRYALLPYIYTLFKQANDTGLPVMRPMVLEFPDDELVFGIDDQFMLGSFLLIKPVVKPAQTTVQLYCPPGSVSLFYIKKNI